HPLEIGRRIRRFSAPGRRDLQGSVLPEWIEDRYPATQPGFLVSSRDGSGHNCLPEAGRGVSLFLRFFGLGNDFLHLTVRTRNYVNADELAHPARRRGPCIRGCFYRPYV